VQRLNKRFVEPDAFGNCQIRSFLSITETLHFGRTAELIHLSQPALTLQIQALEEEVETKVTATGLAFRGRFVSTILNEPYGITAAFCAKR
jgi:hypothetical protein